MPASDGNVIGWDIGGAHVKACLLRRGRVQDVAQWACPLWQGLQHLEQALRGAATRWPMLATAQHTQHAVTMTGEMTDVFAHREDGVRQIAALLSSALPTEPHFYAGDAGWCRSAQVADHWQHIASANWLATARHVALCVDSTSGATAGATRGSAEGVLIDIGSTTTDLIAFKAGQVLSHSRSDVERLASGELVYHGVVRTPLCALAQRIAFRGAELNVMNEFFATSADVYRLTQQLNPAHDLHPSADNAAKDLPATRRRLARMVGLDAREASDADWLAFAQAWRGCQVREIAGQLQRVLAAHTMTADPVFVSAGCGDFLVAEVLDALDSAGGHLATARRRRELRYGGDIVRVAVDAAEGSTAWAQVCAPSVAVAALFDREHG